MLSDSPPIVVVPTTDAQAARPFYEDVLGLPFVDDDGFALAFRLAAGSLRVTRVEAFKPHPFAILAFEVDDIGVTMIELGARGVEFEQYRHLRQDEAGIWTGPTGARVAWFKDPDANTLSLVEPEPHRST